MMVELRDELRDQRERTGLDRTVAEVLYDAEYDLDELIDSAGGHTGGEQPEWGMAGVNLDNDAATLIRNAMASGDAEHVDIALRMTDFSGKLRTMMSGAHLLRERIHDANKRLENRK